MNGNEDHREIIESLKSVARNSSESGETATASDSAPMISTARELGEKFLCPVCETLVAADATVCPACGAEFSEGSATEYECPVCKASVPADADQCPNCGVRFADDSGVAKVAPPVPGLSGAGLDVSGAGRAPALATAPVGPPSAKTSPSPLRNPRRSVR